MNDPTSEFGVSSSVAPLRRVAMRRPVAMLTADHQRWHYTKPLDPEALASQYEHFVRLVADSGAEIFWLDDADDDLADSVFTYDPSFAVPGGAVVLRPGKPLRAGEADLHADFYESAGVPVLGRIEAPGTFEGGDCFWLDPTTLAVGRGFRTNQSGIDQMAEIVVPLGVSVEAYDLPYHLGPDACLHLMSMISVLDTDLALVHLPLVPTALFERMVSMGYELLEAPAAEFDASLGLNLNVLATAPRQVIAVDGFPGTTALMRAAGCEVTTFMADELCIPCEGGPTCLTRPLLRS
ncbi:MAG: dimethylarginine dimethylaminohydrolase family protein [Ilumatobacter sp.]